MRTRRLLVLAALLLLATGVLIARLAWLQILHYDEWQEQALQSRIHVRWLPFHRGRILDARGRVLAEDRRSYDLVWQYRSFRRAHPAGQLFELFALLGRAPGGLDRCMEQAPALAREVLDLRPADLDGLGRGDRADALFYLRRLGGLRSTEEGIAVQEWAERDARRFGEAFPGAASFLARHLEEGAEHLRILEEALGDLLDEPLLERLEAERRVLELHVRRKALRIAAAHPLRLTSSDVPAILARDGPPEPESGEPAPELDRAAFLAELARRWHLEGDPLLLEGLAAALAGEDSGRVEDRLHALGVWLRHVERVAPEDLLGVRRGLVRDVHQGRLRRIAREVPYRVVDLVAQEPGAWPGFLTEEVPVRTLPVAAFPHLVGRVQGASAEDLEERERLQEEAEELRQLLDPAPEQRARLAWIRERLERLDLRPGETRGVAGLEWTYDEILRGRRGYLQVLEAGEEDARPRELAFVPPTHGQDLELFLDAGLQEAAERAIRAGYRRAREQAARDPRIPPGTLRDLERPRSGFALLDLRDGSVPVLATWPTYDPADFRRDYQDLVADPAHPLRQRALGGMPDRWETPYPGSTFKLLIAAEALRADLGQWSRVRVCEGAWAPPGTSRALKCDRISGHGPLAMAEAIQRSCNVYFYKLGQELGYSALYAEARRLGFAGPSGLELTSRPAPDGGFVLREGDPNRALELGAFYLRPPSDPAARHSLAPLHLAIGQGHVASGPLQLARFYGWLATGTLWRPRIVRSVGGEATAAQGERIPLEPGARERLLMALRQVVESRAGTAWDPEAPLGRYLVAGKTGTSQVSGANPEDRLEGRVHGWFAGFLPWDEPRYAVAILAENSGLHGGSICNYILYEFLEDPEVQATLAGLKMRELAGG